jgi:hypothetical protein
LKPTMECLDLREALEVLSPCARVTQFTQCLGFAGDALTSHVVDIPNFLQLAAIAIDQRTS